MELERKAEQLTVQIRWAALAVAAFMLQGRVTPTATILVGGLVAAYNLANFLGARSNASYAKWGQKAGIAARTLDVLLLGASMLSQHVYESSLYLLFLVQLVQIAFVHQKRRTVAQYAIACLACHAIAWAFYPSAKSMYPLVMRSAVIIAGALLAMYVAAYKRQDDVSRIQDKRLAALFDCSMRFVSGDDTQKILTHVLRTAIGQTRATNGYIQLASEENGKQFLTEVALGQEGSFEFPVATQSGEGCAGYVAATGQPLLLNGDASNEHLSHDPAMKDVRAAICVPLLDKGRQLDPSSEKGQEVIGVLSLLAQQPGATFLEEDLDLARTLASLASMAAINARMFERQQKTFLSTLETLARSLEARDEYTRGHSQRVCEVSLMIARAMGLREDVIEEMRVGTLLHDIGKIGIRDAILNKPGRLNDEEFEIMKQHPAIGWSICRPLGLSEGALLLIRNHHERLDGSGYPDQLKGGDLPLSLRIVCVADAFDAMSSRRPYRDVMDEKLRVEQLNRFAGTQFDPVVVQTLKTLLLDRHLDELYHDHWFVTEPVAAPQPETLILPLPEPQEAQHPPKAA